MLGWRSAKRRPYVLHHTSKVNYSNKPFYLSQRSSLKLFTGMGKANSMRAGTFVTGSVSRVQVLLEVLFKILKPVGQETRKAAHSPIWGKSQLLRGPGHPLLIN